VSRSIVLVGARWRGLFQIAQQILSMVATVVLARLLTPADFGVVAAAMSVLGFFSLAGAWGFSLAIVRRETIDGNLLGGVLAANLIMSGVITLLGVLSAPYIASAIGEPEASAAIAMIMPGMFVYAFQSASVALLERRMQYGRMSLIGTLATVLYVVAEIILAAAGFGYWAVIIGYLIMQLVECVGYVILAGWRPRLASPMAVLRRESKFSIGYFANQLVSYANKNMDYWIVATALGAAALGSYYIAFVLPTIVRQRMTTVVQQLLLPVFSRLRSDRERSQRAYAAAVELLAAVGVPAMVGIAVVAEPLVQVFFGSQWSETVEPMRWIALAAAVDLLWVAVGQAALAHGLMLRCLVVGVARMAVLGATIGLTAWAWGLTLANVAASILVASVFSLGLTQVIGVPIGLHLGLIVRPVLRICAISAAMALATWATLAFFEGRGSAAVLQLAAPVVVGAGAYLGLGLLVAPRAYRGYLRDVAHVVGARRSAARAG
jgi:PST family polysaccharide transporter